MGFLDRLLGRSRDERPDIPGMTGGGTPRGYQSPTQAYQGGTYQQQPTAARTAPPSGPAPSGPAAERNPDDVAIDRYRYLLRTAPPTPSSRRTPRRSPSSLLSSAGAS